MVWSSSPPPEELKIPILLDDLRTSPKIRSPFCDPWNYIVFGFGLIMFITVILVIVCVVTLDEDYRELNKQPEIELNSLLVCPTNRDSVILDLKFDITNPYNDDLCIIGGFEVSIFPYNQTDLLLTDPVVIPTTCVGPRNHTSVIAFVEAASNNDYFDPPSTTRSGGRVIRLDLKIHSDKYDLVCGDVKVALSSSNYSSSSSSSCGSMVGDPFACSYTRTTNSSHLWGSFVLLGLFLLFCAGLLTVEAKEYMSTGTLTGRSSVAGTP